jgi:uncharacterized RDD family membrane protein YckC
MQNPPPPPPPSGPPPMSPPPPPPPSGGYMPPPPQPMGGYMPSAAPAGNYGGFWIRVVAYIIDIIILAVIGRVIDAVFQVNPTDTTSGAYGLASFINLVIDIAYFAGQWTYFGATLGQRVFKLRVVDANTGQPIGLGKALLRWVGLIVSFLVCFVGVIWVAFDGRKQGWMDKIAGTLVVQG